MGHTGRLDVLTLGETMALLVPGERPRTWLQTIGGAESNVACHLAGLGLRSGWLGAVGDDELGRAVTAEIAAAGVDVSGVVIDPRRPTGLYLKEIGPSGTRVRYYRSGSAASFLGPDLLSTVDLRGIRLVHTSGITPALSASCLALMRELFAVPRRTHRLSFDVNWRPVLWAGQDVSVLAELANAADIVLVGADEADAVWGFAQPTEIRKVLPGPDTLVVKHGEHGATLIERDPATGADAAPVFQPALIVTDVVETVGAGDAFAAGFLAATLSGAPPRQRLRAGHLRAAGVLSSADDLGTPLPPEVVATLLAADDRAWTNWRSP
ncbi:MAG TPA: sugar kinase [Jatrophihabitantaceae bacterium]